MTVSARATRSSTTVPSGIIPPLVTPLKPDSEVDLESFRRLIDHVLKAGSVGVLALGSTGENGLLGRQQRIDVVQAAVEHTGERAHVMVGLPAMGLKDAVSDAATFVDLGASSILVPAPYGFIHSPSELADYFRTVRTATRDVPILAYNVPSRVGVTLDVDLIGELADEGVIAGIKDSSGDLAAHRSVALRTAAVEGFGLFTGSELCIDAALLGGFTGAIPGLANVVPHMACALHDRAAADDWGGAAHLQTQIVPMARLYAAPTNGGSFTGAAIGALKSALVRLGVIEHPTVSPPFQQPDDAVAAHVEAVLRALEDRPS